ncbi:MAG: Arabinogalactan biosynthesis recruiting protein [Burkholderiales bacterium]|jgi:putative flippase GtrA|nr:Arabinogalactan biosynthesis recruiting protein [Burkholderiales bacterium]
MLKYQIKFYLLCGAISTSFDLLLYLLLVKIGVNISVAKGISFLFATGISYFLNKKITFRSFQKSYAELINFYLAHVLAMIVDVGFNKLFLLIFGLLITGQIILILAFICATSLSVVVNFLSQKFWVFRKQLNVIPGFD